MRSSLHFNASPPQEEPSYACQWARSLECVFRETHAIETELNTGHAG